MGLIHRPHVASGHAGGDHLEHGRLPSTQEQVVALSEVRRDILCLQTSSAHSSSRRRRARASAAERELALYRAVLVASSVNFSLKAAAEQEALLAGYRAFLNGLGFRVQLLIRVRPLDLDPYLARLAAPARDTRDTGDESSAADTDNGDRRPALRTRSAPAVGEQPGPQTTLQRLAADHAVFVRHLAQRHTLLERHFYVVIPADVTLHAGGGTGPSTADASPSDPAASGAFIRRAFRGVLPGARRARAMAEARARFDAVAQRLDLRAGEVVRHLARFGVEARRLEGDQLVALYYSCLSPQAAMLHPLPAAVSAASLSPVQRAARTHETIEVTDVAPGAGSDDLTEARPATASVMLDQPVTLQSVGAATPRPAGPSEGGRG